MVSPTNRFFGEVQYFMDENDSNSPTPNNGDGYAARVGYASGPIRRGGLDGVDAVRRE